MSSFHFRSQKPLIARPTRETVPRRLIVTAGVVAFAVRDWALWVLLRTGPWGPPMRLVLGEESVSDAVERSLEALLLWPQKAPLLELKAGWQEQQVYVWGSTEQGTALSLVHSMLLRANRDTLRPNLHTRPVPSLHVHWVPVADVESGERQLDEQIRPVLQTALYTLRAHIQLEPEIILRFLADMEKMGSPELTGHEWWRENVARPDQHMTIPLNRLQEPATGDGLLTLAEACLLYRAFFSADEQIDLSSLRRRFLATNCLQATDEDRPIRGREMDVRRMSRVYRYLA